jgi:hypothetical protein
MLIYPEHILGLFVLMILGYVWWIRRQPSRFDTETDAWDVHAEVPIVSLEDYVCPNTERNDLIRALWMPLNGALSLPEIKDYVVQFTALSNWWITPDHDPKVPWVLVTRNRSFLLADYSDTLHASLDLLPKRVELVWIPHSTDQFVLKRNRKPLHGRFHPGMPVRSVQSLRQGMYLIRIDALRKKGLRLLPMTYSFERTLCVLFRTYTFFELTVAKRILSPQLVHLSKDVILAYTFQRRAQYDTAALRYMLKHPLTDAQIAEYWSVCMLCMQQHHRSDWMLVHAFDFPISSAVYRGLEHFSVHVSENVDAILLAADPQRQHVLALLIRSDSVRRKMFQLFPLMHPLCVALKLNWTIWDYTTGTGVTVLRPSDTSTRDTASEALNWLQRSTQIKNDALNGPLTLSA